MLKHVSIGHRNIVTFHYYFEVGVFQRMFLSSPILSSIHFRFSFSCYSFPSSSVSSRLFPHPPHHTRARSGLQAEFGTPRIKKMPESSSLPLLLLIPYMQTH